MKKINQIAVFVISVLTAKILSEYLFEFVMRYKNNENPYVDTLIGMAIVAFVFFPALSLMNTQLKQMAAGYVKHSKKISGSAAKGLIWAIVVALFILYYFYLRKWYGIDLFKIF